MFGHLKILSPNKKCVNFNQQNVLTKNIVSNFRFTKKFYCSIQIDYPFRKINHGTIIRTWIDMDKHKQSLN